MPGHRTTLGFVAGSALFLFGSTLAAQATFAHPRPAYVAPSYTAVVHLLSSAEEFSLQHGRLVPTGEHLAIDGKAAVVPAGGGTWLTAIPVVRWPTADGYGQLVLFWHNTTLVGSDLQKSGSL